MTRRGDVPGSSGRYVPPPGSIPTLPVPDLGAVRQVHLVGIGGAGMSGVARILLARGVRVTGSDLKGSGGLDELSRLGASVSVGHRPENVGEPDVVVVSSAIPPDNVEVEEARARGIPVLMRAQALAAVLSGLHTIAVSGTHGKTTTTSMLSVVLDRAGLDPTYVIGGDLNESGSNARAGQGRVAVAEADESDGSFLLLTPAVAIITNVETDHVDFYRRGRKEIEAAFRAFAYRSASVVACADDPGVRRVLSRLRVPVRTYGVGEGADVRLEVDDAPGETTGRLRVGDRSIELRLAVPGRHNLLNAAAVVIAAAQVGVDPATAARALASFTGVRRRYEARGAAGGADVVDDYAHHPTEVAATLAAARGRIDGRRLVAVFQPHRYSRTRAMWRGLGESLAGADLVVVTDVYGAGEQPIPGVTGKLIVDALLESSPGTRVAYLPRRSEIAGFLAREIRPGDLVLTLGAGDITMVGEEILARLRGVEAGATNGGATVAVEAGRGEGSSG